MSKLEDMTSAFAVAPVRQPVAENERSMIIEIYVAVSSEPDHDKIVMSLGKALHYPDLTL